MKRQFIFGTILSAALAVGAAAQQPPPSGQTQPGQPSEASKTVTMAGCLQSAGASASTPGAPASATAGAAGGFILTNASAAKGSMAGGSSSTGSAAGTAGAGAAGAGAAGAGAAGAGAAGAGASTGTTGSRPGAMAGTTYRLTGGDDKDLQKYVGQKIEVTGSLSARGTGSSTAPGASETTGSAASQALSVTSVKPTGERCGQ